MSQPNRLPADAAHEFGGIALDRNKPLRFRLDGRRVDGYIGDTVLSALLANGIDTVGVINGHPLALTDQIAPLVRSKQGDPLPIDRLPATDGADLATLSRVRGLPFGQPHSLRHDLSAPADPPWLRASPETTLTADLLVIGGGVAGLSAADAASAVGHSVIIVERRPWLGGDARYFGPVGDEESPTALTVRLIAALSSRANVTLLTHAEAFALRVGTALVHHIETTATPRGRVISITAPRVVIATGATQRLPVFPGNRLPGVLPSITAYHFAKRYGVVRGKASVIATQSNHAYRLALRLHDAGITIRRIVDTRIGPQSRFIDFAKASGLTLAAGQAPRAVRQLPRGLVHADFANEGTDAVAASYESNLLVVSGGWQPELTLWMRMGGGVRWSREQSTLVATGAIEGVRLAGSATGYRSMHACAESGRAAQAVLFAEDAPPVEDSEPGTHFETPDAPTSRAPQSATAPSYFSTERSLAARPAGFSPHVLGIGDVAASVELGLIAATDAGAIAEEHGAPGAELTASNWRPFEPAATADIPAYLAHRFGESPERVHLIVDGRRRFEIGAPVYLNATQPVEPARAIGVIVATAPIGGIALIAKSALKRRARFIVETEKGPSPARIKLDPAPVVAPVS